MSRELHPDRAVTRTRPSTATIQADFGEDVEEAADTISAIRLTIDLGRAAGWSSGAFAHHDVHASSLDGSAESAHLCVEHAAVAGPEALHDHLNRGLRPDRLEGQTAVRRDLKVQSGIERMGIAPTRWRRWQRLGEELMFDILNDNALGVERVPFGW